MAASKPMAKSAVFASLAEATGMTKKQVASVCEAMHALVQKELSKKGPGVFQLPGLAKITLVHKPATKARPGINPFTKEPTMIKAKPARNVVKIRALKALKDMVK